MVIEKIVNDIFTTLDTDISVSSTDANNKDAGTVDVHQDCITNVVPEEKLRKVQSDTLNQLKNYLSKTYGPFGSMTDIITGQNKDSILADYSKDGLKVLKNIIFNEPIEMSIQSEIVDICKYVESKVGDGTTSAVILASQIFDGLNKIQEAYHLPPRRLIQIFNHCIDNIKSSIADNGKDISLDDIYNICMISTNGNKEVSTAIKSLYNRYGFDVSIDVNISNDADTKVKTYDGLTINQGYSDPAYINNTLTGTADIHNPRIYSFRDPIDTPEMVNFLEAILLKNIFDPINNNEDPIPTVVVAPKISRDASNLLGKLVQILYSFDTKQVQSQKPPVLIVTSLAPSDVDIAYDICNLCHCKEIAKYINADIQKADQEKGEAPTLETVADWYGTAELVSSDADKTKFINPSAMTTEGDKTYDTLLNFLESELKKDIANNDNPNTIGRIKKRIRCLKANMVEYLVGGISISDRDQLKDLVEDAVKNCASAASNGVGRAANFEGLISSYKLAYNCSIDAENRTSKNDKITADIYYTIFKAYYNATKILYSTVVSDEKVDKLIIDSINLEKPFNVMDIFDAVTDEDLNNIGLKDTTVLCSIRTDIEIINAISKIITTMVTSNQCLLQAAILNKY